MAKKLIMLAMVLITAVFAVFGAVYVKKSGLLEPFPDEEFLTDEEAAVRPLYEQLAKEDKAVYTAVYRGILQGEEKISLPFDIDGEAYSRLYMLLEKQEGALFYIDSTYYTAQKLRTAQIVYRTENKSEQNEKLHELEMKTKQILSGVPENADDYGKALYIHDYIVENCRYEVDETNNYGATAYGCLVEGRAHCEGYAKAFSYLLAECGIRSTVVTGVTGEGENHAWNQLEIGGKWYNTDVTWDDTDADGDIRHIYFLCTDEEFCAEPENAVGQVHVPVNNGFEPFRCVDARSYYVREDLYIKNMDDAERVIRRENESGNSVIELKFGSASLYNEFKTTYVEGQRIFDILLENKTPILGSNMSVTLAENADVNCMTIRIS